MTFVSISGIQKPVFQDITQNVHADDSLCLAFWAAVLFNFDIFYYNDNLGKLQKPGTLSLKYWPCSPPYTLESVSLRRQSYAFMH